MVVILLDRKRKSVHIGNTSKDIEKYNNITTIYNVTHVRDPDGGGWYDVYRGKTILGYVTDVDYVKEKW